jgi:hypothetical protein
MPDARYDVGTLASYWRTLLNRADNDEDAWNQLLGQSRNGYLVCDPPVSEDQIQEPSLRYGGRSVSMGTPRLMIKTDDGVLLDAEYFRATLVMKHDTPPEPIPDPKPEPAAVKIAEVSPRPEKPHREANKNRTTPATMTKAEIDAARYRDKLALLEAALSDGKKRTKAQLAEKIDVPWGTFKRWGMNRLKTSDDVSQLRLTLRATDSTM